MRVITRFYMLFRILWSMSRLNIWRVFHARQMLPAWLYSLFAPIAKRARRTSSDGENLREWLTFLGGSFIKFGQILSVRPDIIGEDLADELRLLQDKLPPFPAKVARAIIAKNLKKPCDEVFADFDDTPKATASIAQVHRVHLQDGTPAAVKILRPNVKKTFARDIDLLLFLTKNLERFFPKSRLFKLLEVVETYQSWVMRELNLRIEAASCAELKDNLKRESHIHIPQIYWEYSTSDILVMDWMSGIKIDDKHQLIKAGHDPQQIITHAVELFFLQVFRDGFFHADIHPGNLFIQPNGHLAAVDFGIIGRLDKNLRFFLADILIGFIHHDYDLVARVHFEMGYIPAHQSQKDFALALRAIGEPIFGNTVKMVSFAEILFQMINIARQFEMEPRLDLLLLHKTMLQAEGIGRILVPGMNIWLLSEPLIEEWLLVNRNPLTELKNLGRELLPLLWQLPEIMKTLRTQQKNPSEKYQKNSEIRNVQAPSGLWRKKGFTPALSFIGGMIGGMVLFALWLLPSI